MENEKMKSFIEIQDHLSGPKEKENMRVSFFSSVVIIVALASVTFVPGCNYNVSSPMYDQPSPYKAMPVVTAVDPVSEAKPGVNTVTIHGHNFVVTSTDTLAPSNTVVYFDNTLEATIISIDSTTIVVRRPNVSGDSCSIAVEPHNAAAPAVFKPYKIDPVIVKYGSFLQSDLQLGATAIDNSENLYAVESLAGKVHKVTPDGNNVTLANSGSVTASPLAARIGPDGNLYVTKTKSKIIEKVDVSSGSTAPWTTFSSGLIATGDFGPGNYFYAGGTKTDLRIVPPNPPATIDTTFYKLAHSYSSDTINVIRVFGGYVYVVTGKQAKIWRNQINADGTVAARELFLDMRTTQFASDPVTDLAFSSTGNMIVATNSQDPLLIVDPSGLSIDSFYKGIVPAYAPGIAWSRSTSYLYVLSGYTPLGATAPLQPWNVYQIDMGATGGSNF